QPQHVCRLFAEFSRMPPAGMVDEANIRLLNPSIDEPRALKLTKLLSFHRASVVYQLLCRGPTTNPLVQNTH
ncbi:hypothetical protein, partial [Mesorhizobium sp. M7A.F.Ca.US.001.04.1.1]|uniref:hypothetical protein n=1 Tax=Mesorhizobium sp. M7A.F.Ca.US.001.04.1.1 TaxID=2496726 RepID=UPI0019D26B47